MNRKIAVSSDSNDTLDRHFGHSMFFAIFNKENEGIIAEEKIVPPSHEPGLLLKWLTEKGVRDIIAGGMGQMAIELFNQSGVNAFVGTPQLSSRKLVEGYLHSNLKLSTIIANMTLIMIVVVTKYALY